MPTDSVLTWSGRQVVPLKSNQKSFHQDVVPLLDGTYPAGTLIGYKGGNVELQQLAYSGGAATSGDFKLTFGADQTANIAFDALASAIESALNLLASIIAIGGVTCTGGPINTTPVVVHFPQHANVAALTVDNSGLSGGAHTIVITTTQPGVADALKYGAYDSSHVDGLQNPTHVLQYDVVVASGVHYIADTNESEWRQSEFGVPAWRGGIFDVADLVGLDTTAIANMNARILAGDESLGRVLIPG